MVQCAGDPGREHPHTAGRHYALASSSHVVHAGRTIPSHRSRPAPSGRTIQLHTRIVFFAKMHLALFCPPPKEKPATPVLF